MMIGSMLAGTEESPGETIIYEAAAQSYCVLGSLEAMQKGSKDRYFKTVKTTSRIPEGISGRVPYKGTVLEVIPNHWRLAAGMGYCGALTLPRCKARSSCA